MAVGKYRQLGVTPDERQLGDSACAESDLGADGEGDAPAATCPCTVNGSSAVVANSVRERSSTSGLAYSSPGGAAAISRAARFTVSPMTVYVARYGDPTSPAKTCPRLTPARTRQHGSASNDLTDRPQHPAVVVVLGERNAGDEDHLAAVLVDVGGEERDARPVGARPGPRVTSSCSAAATRRGRCSP